MDVTANVFRGASSSLRATHTRAGRLLLARRVERVSRVLLAAVTLAAAALAIHFRVGLASSLSLQCDEIPLLLRFTGLCGHVSNELEAAAFSPSVYTFRHGALRSVRSPRIYASLHTSSGFWANLTTHLFGASPLAIRAAPMFWSILAIAAAGWGAWLISRSLLAACAAVWFCSFSPHAVVYAAQIRGYAETMALATLLLILLEYFRRRPDRWLRGVLVFGCAWQLSLTVYTAWVYWVLPMLIVAFFVLPPLVDRADLRKSARASLGIIAIGLVISMGVYTVDRWSQIVGHGSMMGESFGSLADVGYFLRGIVWELIPSPAWLSLAILPGVYALSKSPISWWKWGVVAGVGTPLLFALANGSPGYVRNFGFLTGILAILFGLGVNLICRRIRRPICHLPVTIVFVLTFCLSTAWAYAELPARVNRLILPDWGAAVKAVDDQATTVGPRWFCHCLANRWQVNWYRGGVDYGSFLAIPPGESIEVVMGAWRDRSGRPTVYTVAPHRPGIFRDTMPAYLAKSAVVDVIGGVALRRWEGVRIVGAEVESVDPQQPVFLLVASTGVVANELWREFLSKSQAYERGVVTFMHVFGQDARIDSMLVPGKSLPVIRSAMNQVLKLSADDIHVFALKQLPARAMPGE